MKKYVAISGCVEREFRTWAAAERWLRDAPTQEANTGRHNNNRILSPAPPAPAPTESGCRMCLARPPLAALSFCAACVERFPHLDAGARR